MAVRDLRQIREYGASRTGTWAANGALIGGLGTLAIASAGGASGNQDMKFVALCSPVVALPGALVGAVAGASVDLDTVYVLGPRWHVWRPDAVRSGPPEASR